MTGSAIPWCPWTCHVCGADKSYDKKGLIRAADWVAWRGPLDVVGEFSDWEVMRGPSIEYSKPKGLILLCVWDHLDEVVPALTGRLPVDIDRPNDGPWGFIIDHAVRLASKVDHGDLTPYESRSRRGKSGLIGTGRINYIASALSRFNV
ncbi:hypothetical protein CRG98_005011 [Punica granatum]|uniref:Uncharacterized protein n=1 Tax=Punica granatum TaxID=22663 RepID=A0A2I0L1V5_PUNGR|nr:hypothetical protein CRG98_005011 [Punica granatum]